MARLLGLGLLLLALPAWAGDEEDEKRFEELEQQNRELRERVDALESDGERRDLMEAEADALSEEGVGLNLVVRRHNISAIFQIFGNVGLRYDNPALANRSNAFFFNGGIDFFFTARAGDHFHVLSETVFLVSVGQEDDAGKFDQERLWGAWDFNDLFSLKVGLEHGPISRWNNLFHHGRYLELTVNRPFLARFEGDAGILPMHNAGVELRGFKPTTAGRIGYVVFVSNGRAERVNAVQEFSDKNDQKAVDLGVWFAPAKIDGLWVSVVVRWDKIPPEPANPARQGSIDEFVTSFQLQWDAPKFEILSEFAYIQDDDEQSGTEFEHYSAYFQLGYLLNDQWTPYTRFDFRDMDQGDPYYAAADRDLDIWELLFGVRWDFIANAAIKVEIGFGDREERDGGGGVSTRGYVRGGFQLAFVF